MTKCSGGRFVVVQNHVTKELKQSEARPTRSGSVNVYGQAMSLEIAISPDGRLFVEYLQRLCHLHAPTFRAVIPEEEKSWSLYPLLDL